MVENPPSNAGHVSSIPGRGTKIPHAMGQLSPRSTTTQPEHSGAGAPILERSRRATRKSPRAAAKTRRSQIN